MKIIVTGAAGFTGSHVLARLAGRAHEVTCLVRRLEQIAPLRASGFRAELGDLQDESRLAEVFRGHDLLLNIASLGFGHAAGIVAAAERAGVGRAVFVSTTAIFTGLNAPSKKVRVAAEQCVTNSRLAWTIVRPTMIYGSAQDRNICRLVCLVRRSPVIPVIGTGQRLMQPIYVDDLAHAIVAAGVQPACAGRAYNLSGREPLTFDELIRTVAAALNRHRLILHLPHRPIVGMLGFCERRGLVLPLRAEQVLRLEEDKAFSWAEAGRDFGFSPRPFSEGIRRQLVQMGLAPSQP
jgi:uncharacterized protein YbjT (DUF2867 family)